MANHTLMSFSLTVLFLFASAIGQITDELFYDVREEEAPPVRIADLSEDSNISSVISSNELPLLSYRLFSSTESRMFNLNNSTGILSSVAKINREDVCRLQATCTIRLNVGIQSLLSGSSFFQSLTVYVRIIDINDNSPRFPRSTVQLSILESSKIGKSFIIDSASDFDTGVNNSVQSYSLVPPSSTFIIQTERKLDGSLEVSLVVNSPLDRERQPQYELTVVAQDGGEPKRSGEMKIYVNVTDVNDNKPRFNNTTYRVSVNETAPINITIISVPAVDDDLGRNAIVTYRFSDRQTDVDVVNYFAIDSLSGEIYPIKSLTPIQGQTKSIIVEAKDGGLDAKISQCIVHISVLDNANTRPTIRLNLVSASHTVGLSEAASVGSLVAHFITEDPDAGTNGDVSCHINNSSEFSVLQIKSNEYKVILNQVLDREVKSSYQLILRCHDGGQPPLISTATLNVVLFDVNDNLPVVEMSDYFVNITENNASGLKLLTVKATDKDVGENGQIIYLLGESSTTKPKVEVNGTSGDVIILGSFDYEVEKNVNFTVIAVDKGVPPLSATVTVHVAVIDVNDNSPYFTEPVYIFNVKENSAPGAPLGKLQGFDIDSGNNGRLNYRMGSNSSALFLLSTDGNLSTKQSLDRELQTLYTFTVTAFDMGVPSKSTDVQISVYVLDENDNTPVIKYPNTTSNTAIVFYQSVPGTELLHVEAFDADDGDNSKLLYELTTDNKPGFFIIDQNSGSIFLNKQLRKEDRGNVSVVITVSDHGVEPRSTTTNLTFIIAEGNMTSLTYFSQTEQNMLVVIILVSVTLVVAIIVLTIVLLLKRTDKQKQLLENSQYDMKELGDDMYKQAVRVCGGEEIMGKVTTLSQRGSSHGPPPPNDELIVFKMKLAEKYQVDGGDCSFSKESDLSEVLSSVSGETNGCDSGRGASEGEGQDDGASAPNSPRKHMATFKGSPQTPSYFRLDQLKLGSQNSTRHNINVTDSVKLKASGNRKTSLNKNNVTLNSGKYDNQDHYLKEVSKNYQYLDNSKYQYSDRPNKSENSSFNKQNNLIFTQRQSGVMLSPRGNTGLEYEERCDPCPQILASSYRDSTVYYQDADIYSDGHSTTTSGSYTVDNDHFIEDFPEYSETRLVTQINHNPQDVYV